MIYNDIDIEELNKPSVHSDMKVHADAKDLLQVLDKVDVYKRQVMFSIPFSLIGAFGLLYLAKCKISMVSMLGFLMMIGTVVNNGILYVDTVNQLRGEKGLETALVEGGAIRLRPILMTTLTTVLSMLPMAFAYGESGETMQGLALVNVGGLMASTILSLIMLPTIYPVIDKMGRKHFENNDHLIDD